MKTRIPLTNPYMPSYASRKWNLNNEEDSETLHDSDNLKK